MNSEGRVVAIHRYIHMYICTNIKIPLSTMDTAWYLYGTDDVAVCNDSDNIILTTTLSVIS